MNESEKYYLEKEEKTEIRDNSGKCLHSIPTEKKKLTVLQIKCNKYFTFF